MTRFKVTKELLIEELVLLPPKTMISRTGILELLDSLEVMILKTRIKNRRDEFGIELNLEDDLREDCGYYED